MNLNINLLRQHCHFQIFVLEFRIHNGWRKSCCCFFEKELSLNTNCWHIYRAQSDMFVDKGVKWAWTNFLIIEIITTFISKRERHDKLRQCAKMSINWPNTQVFGRCSSLGKTENQLYIALTDVHGRISLSSVLLLLLVNFVIRFR